MRSVLWFGLGLLVACGGGDDPEDSDSDADVGGCESTDGVSPSVLAASLTCPPPAQDNQPRFLLLAITADDPQGAFTLAPLGHTFKGYILANGQELFSERAITCSRDNAGECVGSLASGLVGVDCTSLTNYRFTATLVDDEGNVSAECDFSLPE